LIADDSNIFIFHPEKWAAVLLSPKSGVPVPSYPLTPVNYAYAANSHGTAKPVLAEQKIARYLFDKFSEGITG